MGECARFRAFLAVVLAAGVVTASSRAQDVILKDPHTRPPQVEQPRYIQVDDMLLTEEQLAGPAGVRTQGLALDYQARNVAWEAGIIPYDISPDFSAVERQRILDAMTTWMRVAPVLFVERTTQSGYVRITRDDATETQASPCFSNVGQARYGVVVRTNLGGTCAAGSGAITHELGHLVGLQHEHVRADRDDYVSIDFSNITPNAVFAFNKFPNLPLIGSYDFGSIMHYGARDFAIDRTKPTIIPHPEHASAASRMGQRTAPSDTDHAVVAYLYNAQLRASNITRPTETARRTFSRDDFLLVMQRLHAFYMSKWGLQRPGGLSIDGRPDFLGIAQWIFDIYLGARSAGWSVDGAFDIVQAAITRSDEWRQKNPGRAPLVPSAFTANVSFDRAEFLSVMTRLDQFYQAPEGLLRPDGLSINGGPDFAGIATWIFDVYLGERLRGTSSNAAWVLTENAIKATDEWRRKH